MGAWLVVAILALTSACSTEPDAGPDRPDVAASEVAGTAFRGQATVDALARSARAADRGAFDRTVSTRDPAFAGRARLLYANLSTLPLADLQLRLQPGERPLTESRQRLLGSEAWRQPAEVTWRLLGETEAAEHTVWLTFVPVGSTAVLAGTADHPPEQAARSPIWWTGPVTAERRGPVTVLVGAGQPADRWLSRSTTAAESVRRRLGAGAAAGWSGALVVEVPATRRDFEAVVGAASGSYAAIAAVTLAEGPSSTSAVRIVVNPDVAKTLAPLGVDVVLVHEAVHVATRSADTPAPTWIVEGLADYVALDVHPGAGDGAAEPLLDRVRRQGAPRALPTDDRFRAGQPDLDVSYAAAWLACRYLAERYSPAGLQRLYTALDQGRPLDSAIPDELGVDSTAFVVGWRSYLVQQAGR